MIIDQEKNKLLYIVKGASTIFLYFFISLFKYLPFRLLNIDVNAVSGKALNIYSLSIELFMIAIIYLIFEKEIKLAIKNIKENHEKYFSDNFKVYLIGVLVMVISNVLINYLGGGLSDNESTIRDEFQKFPIYTYIAAVVFAPILEESIFRLSFKALIQNKYIYIIISGLIFGGLHLIGMKLNYLFPIYLISYCCCGWAFAYMMSKTNNILVSTGFHLMHNGFLMAMQFFLLLFT